MDRNPAPAEFIDMFNHRLLSLDHRAWEKSRPYIRYEREQNAGLDRQTLSKWAHSLMGAGTTALSDRLQLSERLLLRYAAFFMPVTRPAACLQSMLQDFFGGPAEVQDFRGRWCDIRMSDRASLDRSATRLGEGCMLGTTTWYQQASVRVRFAELSLDRFLNFLPGTRCFGEAVEFIHHFTRRQFEDIEIELEVRLTSQDVASLKHTSGKIPLRLGWTSWMSVRGERGTVSRNVVFRSTEGPAITRRWIQAELVKTKRKWRNQRLDVSWNEEVVQTLITSCGNIRPTRLYVARIVERLLGKSLETFSEGRRAAASNVRIDATNGNLNFQEI